MRRLVGAFAAAALVLGSAGAVTGCSGSSSERTGALAAAPQKRQAKKGPATDGALHATARQAFVGAQGVEELKGPNLQPIWGPADTRTWDQGAYDSIRAKGFTAVRFVLFWDDFEPTKGKWNETAFTTLSTALARAKSAGLYAVLDCVHLYGQPEGQSRVPEWARTTDGMGAVVTNGLNFLKQLASRYGADDTVAAYDPVNEPYRWPMNHRSVLADYTKIVNAIRSVDATTNIMIEPSYGDAKVPDADLTALAPASRANLIWSFHDYYTGTSGDGYREDGLGHSPNASDGTTGYDPANKADLAAHLQVQINTAAKAGMPLWIGEFGIGAQATGHDRFIQDKVALYKSKGLGYSWWEYSDDGTFSMVDGNGAWKPWVNLLF